MDIDKAILSLTYDFYKHMFFELLYYI